MLAFYRTQQHPFELKNSELQVLTRENQTYYKFSKQIRNFEEDLRSIQLNQELHLFFEALCFLQRLKATL